MKPLASSEDEGLSRNRSKLGIEAKAPRVRFGVGLHCLALPSSSKAPPQSTMSELLPRCLGLIAAGGASSAFGDSASDSFSRGNAYSGARADLGGLGDGDFRRRCRDGTNAKQRTGNEHSAAVEIDFRTRINLDRKADTNFRERDRVNSAAVEVDFRTRMNLDRKCNTNFCAPDQIDSAKPPRIFNFDTN